MERLPKLGEGAQHNGYFYLCTAIEGERYTLICVELETVLLRTAQELRASRDFTWLEGPPFGMIPSRRTQMSYVIPFGGSESVLPEGQWSSLARHLLAIARTISFREGGDFNIQIEIVSPPPGLRINRERRLVSRTELEQDVDQLYANFFELIREFEPAYRQELSILFTILGARLQPFPNLKEEPGPGTMMAIPPLDPIEAPTRFQRSDPL